MARTYSAEPDSGAGRSVLKWGVAFVFFLALLGMLASLQLYQATAEGTSKRTLRRAVAAITEIDPLLDRNYDDLQERAGSADAPGSEFELRGFPIAIPLTATEAKLPKPQLRELLLDRSANVMYSHGTSVLHAGNGDPSSAGRFSVGGMSQRGLDFLRKRNHDILAALTFALAALSLLLGLALIALCRGFGRLASVGAVVLFAAIPVLVAGIGARFYMRILDESDSEYVRRESLLIGQGLAWIPIRNGLAFAACGALIMLIGMALAVWSDRREAPRYAAVGSRPH